MSERNHKYDVTITWSGNLGTGTSGYREYSRDHVISAEGKPDIAASSDTAFRGDAARWNPEEMLVASLSACHKLWYLHFCAVSGVVVGEYIDKAEGVMTIPEYSVGSFTKVVLRPEVTLIKGDVQTAIDLHKDAHEKCFIANSVNFPVSIEPTIITAK